MIVNSSNTTEIGSAMGGRGPVQSSLPMSQVHNLINAESGS